MKKLFSSKEQIGNLILQADDNLETKFLISQFDTLKNKRTPFYLSLAELELIFKWKLRTQYARTSKIRLKNSNENIKLITQMAFLLSHPDKNIETSLKLKALTLIYGVEIPVASAILTLCFPKKYSVIDFRNWRQVFDEQKRKTQYSVSEYCNYLDIINSLATEFSFTTQEIDMAIWQKDINENG
jgi:hypothetical protein